MTKTRGQEWAISWRPPDGYLAALESSPDAIVLLDRSGTIQFVNSAGVRLLAAAASAELIGRPWLDLWSAADRSSAEAALARAMASDPAEFMAQLGTPPAQVKHLHTLASPLRDGAGAPVGVLVTSRDVSALEEARRAAELRETASAHQASVLRRVADMVHLNSAEADYRSGRVYLSDEGVQLVHGDPQHRVVSIEDAYSQYSEADQVRIKKQEERLRTRGERVNFEAPITRQDGTRGWVRVIAEPINEHGECVGARYAAMDISAEVSARETIERAQQRLKLAAQLVGMEVYQLDFDQHTLIQEGSTASILEQPLTYEDLWPDPLALIDPRDRARVREEWRHARQNGALFRSEFRTQRRDGRELWVYAVSELVENEGRPPRLLAAVIDVSERKRAELALLETMAKMHEHEAHQKLLLDELNHRVKNTLAAVQSVAKQTLTQAREPEEARDLFIDRLMALSSTHNLLVKSAWDSASLRELVTASLEPFGRAYRCHGPDLHLDPNYAVSLGMALHELAINALKHGAWRQAGEVDITTSVGGAGVRIIWRERGGPPVSPPTRRGFGARLLERGLARELGGDVTLHFAPEGLTCEIAAPASSRLSPIGS